MANWPYGTLKEDRKLTQRHRSTLVVAPKGETSHLFVGMPLKPEQTGTLEAVNWPERGHCRHAAGTQTLQE